MNADQNLLFGVLALQMELVDAQQFADACAGWAARKDRSLADLLIERHWITAEDRHEVERLLQRKLKKHGGDVFRTLASSVNDAKVRQATLAIENPDVQQTLAGITVVPEETEVSLPAASAGKEGRYYIRRVFAEGGLGRIYLAQDTHLNREVALKEIKPQFAKHPEASRRFVREAQVTGQLEHPNIVPVYELSQRAGDGTPFYAMRLVKGQTLQSAISQYHLRRRERRADQLELPRLLRAFVCVCQAIAFAHSRGVIHRDLKPENVLLGDFGEVVVLDWGLAKIMNQPDEGEPTHVEITDDAHTEATKLGRVMGTPAYMAPEQAEGRLDLVGPATDVYGLGALLFKILTDHPPHAGSDWMAMIDSVLNGPTPRARTMEHAVSPALDAVCAKAMAKAAADRYASATELARDVERFLADEPPSSYREPFGQQALRWLRRHRGYALTLLATVAGVLITMTVASILLARKADQERQARVAADEMREQGLRAAATFAARSVAFEMDLRWRILEMEAADPELRRLLVAISAGQDPKKHAEWDKMQKLLDDLRQEHSATTKALNWALFDAKGIQLGRSPYADTVGENWAYRDYFHGQGRDLKRGAQPPPIQEPYRSTVFVSQGSKMRVVSFSVPVWDGNPDRPDRKVLGILIMTVELGSFEVLQIGLSKNQVAVLVDTRDDWIEEEQRSGLLLHHPDLRGKAAEKMPVYRLDTDRIRRLQQLRLSRIKQYQDAEQLPWEEQLTQKRALLPGNLEQQYRDPVAGDYAGDWLAAFEPVLVMGRPDKIKDTGWVVIVQDRPRKK